MKRTIGIVSVARSDYGIYTPILDAIEGSRALRYKLLVTGSHLDRKAGYSINEIRKDGRPIAARVESAGPDTAQGIAQSMGKVMKGLSAVYARTKPDLLLLVGDRYEMHAAAAAAVPFGLPMAHIHGGEITEGSFDNAWRFGISAMSHIHFVAHPAAKRVLQKAGEETWRIIVSGAPALDRLHDFNALSRRQLEALLRMPLRRSPLLITFHPETMRVGELESQTHTLMTALSKVNAPLIFTAPNADTRHAFIDRAIRRFVASHADARYVPHLGVQAYWSLMKLASVMVGNSSSGIIEAPSFRLPVVNLGIRQRGRLRGQNVIDVDFNVNRILQGLRRAQSSRFRQHLRRSTNLYGKGHASEIIARTLAAIKINDRLLIKKRGTGR